MHKKEIEKFLEDIKKKFEWFHNCKCKIIDNKVSMHIIVRTSDNFRVPSRTDTKNHEYYLREIFDKSDEFFINENIFLKEEGIFEYWFIFNNLIQ